MALVSIKGLVLTHGHPPLFDGAELHIEAGDRLCLLGRNGSGKSTLLRLIAGTELPDGGSVAVARGLSIAHVGQEIPDGGGGSALDYCLSRGAPELGGRKALTQFGIDPDAPIGPLSGGARRRVALATGLACDADLLLLDEPTNHLDLRAVLWLERHLVSTATTLVLVTHDRAFARAVATRVAHIDRGVIYAFDADFDSFLRLRDEQLSAEEAQRAKADRLRAQEEAWLARGVKARRTRDEGRVRALLRMRDAYAARRSSPGQMRVVVDEAARSGTLVVEATGASFRYGDGPAVIDNLTTTIVRGDRVGIAGPNGAGKTTLVRLLLGELAPTAGTVRRGVNLEPLYFDQMRSLLDPGLSVAETISGGDDTVVIGGRPIHINAYLERFLFEPARAKMAVGYLSGGEQNRVVLATLFARPSNLLVLDEPTNDLDLETLDLLEELIIDYAGTVLLVTHDREFLDRVVTSSFVLGGDGSVVEYAGGYSDWKDRVSWAAGDSRRTLASGAAARGRTGATGDGAPSSGAARAGAPSSGATGHPSSAHPRPTDRPPKRTYRENEELEALPDRIALLEDEIETIHHRLADPALYSAAGTDGGAVRDLTVRLDEAERALAAAYRRWEELEAKEA